jgi:sugar (pentulose or hexulose) kinase
MSGGGAQGTLWPQIVADVLELPVRIGTTAEASGLGAAMLAAQAVGLPAGPSKPQPSARIHEPDPTAAAAYGPLYDRWRDVYAEVLHLTHRMGLLPMWDAPGAAGI